MRWLWQDYPDRHAQAAALADALLNACHRAHAQSRIATLALAGGTTPLPAYRAFADKLHDAIRVAAVPSDERCVPHDDPACNYAALRAALAGPAQLACLPISADDGDVGRSLALARARLASLREPFDAVLLGMGGDGHFASLFPGAANLMQALDAAGDETAFAIEPDPLPPEAPYTRISLSLSRLIDARALHLAITGDDKRAVIEAAMQPEADPRRWPVAALLHAPARLHIHWSP